MKAAPARKKNISGAKEDGVYRDRRLQVVEKLHDIAKELRQGANFNITRLTVIKPLCQDACSAVRFGLYLMNKVKSRAKGEYRPLVNRAILEMKKYLKRPSFPPSESLYDALEALEQSQNQYEHQHWADVRIIHSWQALMAEYALRCATQPSASSYFGYHLARMYAERSDSRFPTGLVRVSAPLVEDIARFWARYMGKGYRLKISKRTPRYEVIR